MSRVGASGAWSGKADASGARRAVLAWLAVALLYVGGAVASASLSPLARRPLLDGVVPPTAYRWVKPPPALAPTNKTPTPMHFSLEFGPKGSDVGAFSTQDGQFNMVFGESAFAPTPGQSGVSFDVVPVDPATVAPVPSGLLAAGNAYRFTVRYEPSRRPVNKLDGEVNAGVVYPLLAVPVASPTGHVLLYSADGKAAWARLESTDAPGVHQVSARIPGPGYFIVAIPPGSAAPAERSLADRVRGLLPLVTLALLAAAAVLLVVRRADFQRLLAARSRPADAKPADAKPKAADTKPADAEPADAEPKAADREAAGRAPSPGKDSDAKPKPAGGKRPGDAKRRRRR